MIPSNHYVSICRRQLLRRPLSQQPRLKLQNSFGTFTTALWNGNDEENCSNKLDKTNNADKNDYSSFTTSLLQSAIGRANNVLKNKNGFYDHADIKSNNNDRETDLVKRNDNSNGANEKSQVTDVIDVEIDDLLQNTMNRANDALSPSPDDTSSSSSTTISDLMETSTQRADQGISSTSSTTTTTTTTTTTSSIDPSMESDESVVITATTTTTTSVNASPTSESQTDLGATSTPSSSTPPTPKKTKSQDKRIYLDQPAVTNTALAHSIWSQVLIPYQDTVIDATCGNGKDSLVLANYLFPSSTASSHSLESSKIQPELICIDVQSRAISNTTDLLQSNLPPLIYSNHVSMLQTSHDNNLRSMPKDISSVGLVCYNLGWLPGGEGSDAKKVSTDMSSTLRSMVDAVHILRVGGLLSVLTYPGSDQLEAIAVSLFCESLAMFTSKEQNKKGGWEAFIDDYQEYKGKVDDEEYAVMKSEVKESIRMVWMEGAPKQTWRVFEHKPMGRPFSPILVTAMRIK